MVGVSELELAWLEKLLIQNFVQSGQKGQDRHLRLIFDDHELPEPITQYFKVIIGIGSE